MKVLTGWKGSGSRGKEAKSDEAQRGHSEKEVTEGLARDLVKSAAESLLPRRIRVPGGGHDRDADDHEYDASCHDGEPSQDGGELSLATTQRLES
jgi:hypothetical protein